MTTSPSTYYSNRRPEMKPFLPSAYERVLEVGCGEGAFRSITSPDCEYWGVEVHPNHSEKASAVMDKVLTGGYFDVAGQLPSNFFDLVVCNDIIEHLEDHDRFLQDIRFRMQEGACLVASVPNVRYYKNLLELLFLKDWRYREEGILDRTHLRFFTEKSLRRTLEQHGFRVEKFAGINSANTDLWRMTGLQRTVFFSLVRLMTFNSWQDIQFLQFAFRARTA